MVIFLTSAVTRKAVNNVEETTPGSFKFLFLLNIFLEKYSVKA